MVSLQDMSTIHSPGSPPRMCERTGRLCALPQREIYSTTQRLDYYPEININCDAFNSASIAGSSLASAKCADSWRNVLVPVNEGVLKRIIRTFFESGFAEALNEARDTQVAGGNAMISSVAEYTFQTIEFLKRVKSKIFPHMKEQGISSIARHSETRDWIRSYIRCIVWHPNCFKIAVAGMDDIVRIYTDEPAIVPVLKSASQKWITCMAWRPYTAAELAVGCQKGICLWTMDNNMHITRSTSQAIFLKHPNHCPITSVQWNSDGTLLASASIGDTDVIIWDADKMQNTALKRVGPPCSLLKWSPNSSCLFSSTVTNVFRVWACENKWQPERWTITHGSIQSACWSPCGGFLLFVTSEEPILYRLQFFEEQLFKNGSSPKQALPIADLSKITVDNREVGGHPQCVAWDPNGHFLAITFKDTPCIAIFTTCIQKFNLSISPSCFLAGNGNEYPSYICFQSKHRKNSDTVLTIGWSSGRIQYFPFGNM
ncbi:aladin [Stomoxys calcitrans]|uniref:aladin n=1 Tax=Stomoxys calcitrans TaxID=35570 RepID=UPI0027E344E1|nr:aladin [Stomoxys calcitrans]